MTRTKLVLTASFLGLVPCTALAATPTYYNNRAVFEGEVLFSFTDNFDAPPYNPNGQNNAAMSAVFGETQFQSTGHNNVNITSDYYCGGCNGSFLLSFQDTSYGDEVGVRAVGIDVYAHDLMLAYHAYITFGDGTTEDVMLPPEGTFWGLTVNERIQSIHFGLADGGPTQNGYFAIDHLIIGDFVDETPCGDGIVHDDEDCDEMGQTAECEANCHFATCGDGIFNALAGETCDDGGPSPTCNADCSAPSCGDGIVNPVAGETCDAAGETAACDLDCTTATCGDGQLNLTAGETCDDSAQSPTCDADCTAVECGDGDENNIAGEYCDDGNTDDGDGCSATCTVEPGSEGDGSSGAAESSEGGSEGGTTGEGTTGGSEDGGTAGDDTTGSNDAGSSDGGNTNGDTDDPSGPSTTLSTTDAPADTSGDGSSSSDDASADGNTGGCGCASEPKDRGIAWSTLMLLGLGTLARRRR